MNDANDLFNILQEADILKYFPSQTAWPMEKVEKYISHQLQHWNEHGYGHWAVVLRENGELVGWNGLEFLPDTNETEVGYLLSGLYWGKGFATESARTVVDFGFANLGLQEIAGLTHPENIASQRVLEKSGLSFTRRQKYFGMEMFRFAAQAEGPK
jgi:ribosomal-protein-alanine N-acetyltransferase